MLEIFSKSEPEGDKENVCGHDVCHKQGSHYGGAPDKINGCEDNFTHLV